MTVTCGICRERFDDADRNTICPHPLIMPRTDLEQKKLAISLLGKEVRFAHQEVNPTWYRITSMSWNGMLTLDGLPGEFAAHLFVAGRKDRVEMSVSLYWQNLGKTEADVRPGETFRRTGGLACGECCTKMISQIECNCFHRDSCPYCLGTSLNASCFDAKGDRIK